MGDEGQVSVVLVLATCLVGVAAASLLAYTLFHFRKLQTLDMPKEKLRQMFVPPMEREMYLKRKAEGAPEDEVRGRLMARAVATVRIKEQHKTESWKAQQLYRRGMLDNDQHNLQKIVDEYLNSEFQEISEEVESLTPGAVQSFWQQAHAIHFHQMRQQAMAKAQAQQQAQDGSTAAGAAGGAGGAGSSSGAAEEKQRELTPEEKQRLADKAAEELLREEAAEKARKRKSNKKK